MSNETMKYSIALALQQGLIHITGKDDDGEDLIGLTEKGWMELEAKGFTKRVEKKDQP